MCYGRAGLVAEEIEHHAFAQFLVDEHAEKFFSDGLGNAACAFAALFINAGIYAAAPVQSLATSGLLIRR